MNLNSSPINDVDHDQRHRPVVSSSASRNFFFSSTQDHAGFSRHQPHEDDSYLYHGGSCYEIKNKVERGLWRREDNNDNRVKWISDPTVCIAKAKIDRYTKSNSSLYTPIRVCSDCHTTKTPLWRSGPKGPKSLCNACGIRQRKARRASGTAKEGRSLEFKKRCKMAGGSKKQKRGFEDFLINLSNKLALHRVFPQDEKDAAILLMALSSGLLHG